MALTYDPIATTTLGSAAASVTFSSISGSFTDLVLILNSKGATSSGYPYLQFNGDTNTNYSTTYILGSGSNATSGRYSNINQLYLSNSIGGFDTSNFNWNSITYIQNYANTTTYKTILTRGNIASGGTEASVALWRATPAAITSILVGGSSNFAIGSTFTLYGIKAA